ncbi:hypothetical protein GQ53DRAFT_744015 [Thozetella sp. PMI_491]|nr:hypothetical protein GQ53DRAFT_744015 [Thozetella sp. PMI_491]
MNKIHTKTLFSALLLALWSPVGAQSGNLTSKRGFGFTADSQNADINLLLSGKSPLDWYYTWSLYPATTVNDTRPFVPLIHGLDDASQSGLEDLLDKLPSSSTHLLAFNEPDEQENSGGSAVSPEDAAKSYIDHIVPLRTAGRRWNISHPVTTGSSRGLDWLRQFNESCYDIDSKHGCPADFLAVHWYGNFDGLKAWVETLRDFYGNSTATAHLPFWLTEFALPQGDSDATAGMMNESLAYLDGLDYIDAYAWFGAFRADKANGFVGGNVALFDSSGKLTEIGATYLGGTANGFAQGMGGNAAASVRVSAWTMALVGFAVLFSM